MDSDAESKAVEQQPSSARLGVWRFAAIVALLSILAGTLYYGNSLEHENTFSDDKAFRVLADVIAQLTNLQVSRATLLNSMPTQILQAMPECNTPDTKREDVSPERYRQYRQHIARLDLAAATLCRPEAVEVIAASPWRDSPLTRSVNAICHGAPPGEIRFGVSLRDGHLLTALCAQPEEDAKGLKGTLPHHYAIQESFDKAAGKIVSQEFFTEALLSTTEGAVLGEFPRHDSLGDTEVRLQPATGIRLNIVNAHQLLSAAPPLAPQTDSKSSEDKPSKAIPLEPSRHPATHPHDIGNRHYQVYVLPFRNPYRLSQLSAPLDSNSETAADDSLYVVGIRQMDMTGDIARAMWPKGSWILTVILLVSLLSWPSFSLLFGPDEQSISLPKAIACVVAAILIPGALTVAAVSICSTLQLESWMSGKLEGYAKTLETRLHTDLTQAANILTTYREFYQTFITEPDEPPTCPKPEAKWWIDNRRQALPDCSVPIPQGPTPVIRIDESGQRVHVCVKQTQIEQTEDCGAARLYPGPQNVVTWSPFRSITAVNRNGDRFGPVLTAFTGQRVKSTLQLRNREYFQALTKGQQWIENIPGSEPAQVQFVAERLFNRTDASKSLQIAVPIPCPNDKAGLEGGFCGLVTGDMRMHDFMSAVMPPLLQFAVVDASTGTVVFHSNDSRSLAENFFRETENNPALLAALKTREPAHFGGRYLGDPTEFYFVPVSDTPWGIVVFYADRDLENLPVMAGISTLFAYGGIFTAIIAVVALILFIIGMRRGNHPTTSQALERFWPRAPVIVLFSSLARFRPSFWAAIALCGATLYAAPATCTIASVVAAVIIPAALGWKWRAPTDQQLSSEDSAERWRTAGIARVFAEGSTVILWLVSVLPCWCLFYMFHQDQVTGLSVDGLVEAANRMQERYNLIQQDLQRWVSLDGRDPDGEVTYPDAAKLAKQPDLGLADAEGSISVGPPVDIKSAPEKIAPPRLNEFERVVWQSMAKSASQQRRIALLDGRASDSIICDPAEAKCELKTLRADEIIVRGDPRQVSIGAQTGELFWEPALAVLLSFLIVRAATVHFLFELGRKLFGLETAYARFATPPPDEAGLEFEPCPIEPRSFELIWAGLTRPERLVLYQAASGQIVNPRNRAAEVLREKTSLLRIAPWPKLRWCKLEPLIRQAEKPADFERWQTNAAKGVWKSIRIPLFILLMGLVAWLSWAEGGSMKALSAIFLATAAFLGQLLQLVNFARGTPGTSAKGG